MSTTTTQTTLEDCIGNLDAFNDPNDLWNQREYLQQMATGFHMLSDYTEAKAHAMSYRLKGEIGMACKFEARCEKIYEKLPAWARTW